jgi:hypothetical protein
MPTRPRSGSGFDAVLDAALLGGSAPRAVRDHGNYLGVFPGREPAAERITVRGAVVAADGTLLGEMLAWVAGAGVACSIGSRRCPDGSNTVVLSGRLIIVKTVLDGTRARVTATRWPLGG